MAQAADAEVVGGGVHERARLFGRGQVVPAFVEAHEGLLGNVLRLVGVAGEGRHEAHDGVEVPGEECLESEYFALYHALCLYVV